MQACPRLLSTQTLSQLRRREGIDASGGNTLLFAMWLPRRRGGVLQFPLLSLFLGEGNSSLSLNITFRIQRRCRRRRRWYIACSLAYLFSFLPPPSIRASKLQNSTKRGVVEAKGPPTHSVLVLCKV